MGLEITAMWLSAAATVASGQRKAGDAVREILDAAMMQTGTSAPPPGAPAAWLVFRKACWPRARVPASLAAMDGVAAEVGRIAYQVGKAGKAAAAMGANTPFKVAMKAAVDAGAPRLPLPEYTVFAKTMRDKPVTGRTLAAAAHSCGVRLPKELYDALVAG
jgi:hypothetical protein